MKPKDLLDYLGVITDTRHVTLPNGIQLAVRIVEVKLIDPAGQERIWGFQSPLSEAQLLMHSPGEVERRWRSKVLIQIDDLLRDGWSFPKKEAY